jgi:hypothetical protein
MEADFLAGLNDHDSVARLASIQRLGGLKLPSSRDVLHRVIEKGDDAESKWAVHAALRTSEVTVLSRVKQLLANGDSDLPEFAIAMGEVTRTRVLIALGENIKDPRRCPV